MRPQARRDLVGDAEPLQHLGEVDSGGRELGVGEVDAVGGAQRRPQRIGIADGGSGIAAAHRHPGCDGAEVGRRARHHVAGPGELGDQRRGEDQQVGGLAADELVAHRADRAEGAVDVDAGVRLELSAERGDETVRSAAGEERELHEAPVLAKSVRYSTLMLAVFTTFAHFAMSFSR